MPVRDLTRNGLDYTSDILYVQDLGNENIKLLEYYPGRSFYQYVREPDSVAGRLIKIR